MTTSFRFLLGALLLALVGSAPAARAQRAVWSTLFNGGYLDTNSGSPTATDADGNTYLAGIFGGTLQIGGQSITAAPDDYDVFVAKLNAAGQLQWLQRVHSLPNPDTSYSHYTGNDGALNIGLSPNGQHLYLAGLCGRDLHFGTFALDSAGEYLTKIDVATGEPLWLRQIGRIDSRYSTFSCLIRGLAADNVGNGYLTALGGQDTLGNLPLGGIVGDHYPTRLIAKCSPAGQFLWVSQIYSRGHYRFLPTYARNMGLETIAVDALGGVTIGGSYWGSFFFGSPNSPDSLATYPSDTTFTSRPVLAHYSPAGALEWLRTSSMPGGLYRLVGDAAGTTYASYYGQGPGSNGSFAGLPLTIGTNYMMKLNPQGVGQWATPCTNLGHVAVDDQGRSYLSGTMILSTTIGSVTLAGASTGWQPFVAAFDVSGGVRWARTAAPIATTPATYGVGMGVGLDRLGRVYQTGQMWPDRAGDVGQLDIDGRVVKGLGTFVYRFDEAARVLGSAYFDANGDGVRNPGEGPFPRPVVVREVSRPFMAASSPRNGRFTVFADTGAYHLGVPVPPANYALTQGLAGYLGHLRTYGQADTARTFGLKAIPNRSDIRVTLTPYSAARPGRATHYRARIENMGTTTAAGQLTVQLDGAATYVGAQPAPTAQSGRTLSWSFSNLAPFGTREFTIAASLLSTIAVRTPLLTTARAPLTNDLTPANNADSVRQEVTGSLDPNDLTVNFTTLTPAQIAAGAPLDYLIQFQNIGTDTAFSVVIHDSLPAQLLQLGTLELVAQSHNVEWMLDETGLLYLRFPGIELPHRAVDAVSSMGFVRFQVKPGAALQPGQLIPNTAHITFDYNAPLATNQVTTLVQSPNGLVAEPNAPAAWSLYPNPAAAAATVTLTATLPTAGPVQVRLTDALGRPVQQRTVAAAPAGEWRHELRVADLAPGVYVVQLTLPNGTATTGRLVLTAR